MTSPRHTAAWHGGPGLRIRRDHQAAGPSSPVTSAGTTLPPEAPVPPWKGDLDTGLRGPSGPRTGTLIAGRYLVRERLDACEEPQRYRALHVGMQREVAIEFFDVSSAERRTRLLSALAAVNRLPGERVLAPSDSGEAPEGYAWLVFDRVARRSLARPLRSAGRLSPPAAVRVAVSLAEGIAQAARAGWRCEEIRPEHVLAYPRAGGGWEVALALLGRPSDGSGEAAERAGVRALGGLLCTLLGVRWVASDPPTRMARLWLAPSASVRLEEAGHLPAPLRRVLLKALQPHPRDRFASLSRMRHALEQVALDLAGTRRSARTAAGRARNGPAAPALRPAAARAHGSAAFDPTLPACSLSSAETARRSGGWVRPAAAGLAVAILFVLVAWLGLGRGRLPRGRALSSLGAARLDALGTRPGDAAHRQGRRAREPRCSAPEAAGRIARLARLVQTGRAREATKLRDRLVDALPTCGRLRLLSGALERLRGRPAAARFAYRRALQLDPTLRRDPRLIGGLLALAAQPGAAARSEARSARAVARRYLDRTAAPQLARLVNTHTDPELVRWGVAFLRDLGAASHVDFLHAYAVLLSRDPSCKRRRALIHDLERRADPRFEPLLRLVAGAPGAPTHLGSERVVLRVPAGCVRAAARQALTRIQAQARTALAQAE